VLELSVLAPTAGGDEIRILTGLRPTNSFRRCFVRHWIGTLCLVGAFSFLACQQTQEADEGEDEGTTVIEEETDVVPGPPGAPGTPGAPAPGDAPDMDVDIEMKTDTTP
jgi:hypothetical protein